MGRDLAGPACIQNRILPLKGERLYWDQRGSVMRSWARGLAVRSVLLLLALATFAASASAGVTQTMLPVSQDIGHDQGQTCLAEPVSLNGFLQVAAAVENTELGPRVTALLSWQGVSGVGLLSGQDYQATAVTQSTIYYEPHASLPFTFVIAGSLDLVGSGIGGNYQDLGVVQVTVGADQQVTAVVRNLASKCN